jgi:hypothetical protein
MFFTKGRPLKWQALENRPEAQEVHYCASLYMGNVRFEDISLIVLPAAVSLISQFSPMAHES